jgi:hypothetical protein
MKKVEGSIAAEPTPAAPLATLSVSLMLLQGLLL